MTISTAVVVIGYVFTVRSFFSTKGSAANKHLCARGLITTALSLLAYFSIAAISEPDFAVFLRMIPNWLGYGSWLIGKQYAAVTFPVILLSTTALLWKYYAGQPASRKTPMHVGLYVAGGMAASALLWMAVLTCCAGEYSRALNPY